MFIPDSRVCCNNAAIWNIIIKLYDESCYLGPFPLYHMSQTLVILKYELWHNDGRRVEHCSGCFLSQTFIIYFKGYLSNLQESALLPRFVNFKIKKHQRGNPYKMSKGSFNNYVGKMRGGGGQKISVFVHTQGIKTVHAGHSGRA